MVVTEPTDATHAALAAVLAEYEAVLANRRFRRDTIQALLERLEPLMPEVPQSVTARTLYAKLLAFTSREAEVTDAALEALRLGSTDPMLMLAFRDERAFDHLWAAYAADPNNASLRMQTLFPLFLRARQLGRTDVMLSLAIDRVSWPPQLFDEVDLPEIEDALLTVGPDDAAYDASVPALAARRLQRLVEGLEEGTDELAFVAALRVGWRTGALIELTTILRDWAPFVEPSAHAAATRAVAALMGEAVAYDPTAPRPADLLAAFAQALVATRDADADEARGSLRVFEFECARQGRGARTWRWERTLLSTRMCERFGADDA
jgi:hypothetical protein